MRETFTAAFFKRSYALPGRELIYWNMFIEPHIDAVRLVAREGGFSVSLTVPTQVNMLDAMLHASKQLMRLLDEAHYARCNKHFLEWYEELVEKGGFRG